ncbi:hypothetical protein SAY87_032042 [Trapa incisa]|uniref:Pentatricopeptide repeat-containing protein n=1 Tax=Trapa incisa TaxID=236973 RepID=A0AAN7KR81_9MYRT|nr:hypothetical protein SAY87_032042 [Trapa incisa]
MLPRSASSARLLLRLGQRPLSTIASPADSDELKKLNRKDWLAPNEVLNIIKNLRDPKSVVIALDRYSTRKDYKPNEALYTLTISILAHGKMFDAIEGIMERIRVEKRCRLSDEFFYNVIKIYGNVAGRVRRAMETLYDMPQKYNVWPSVKSFNFVLNLLVSWKLFDFVHEVYVRAPELGVEIDACCLNILLKGLCEGGNLNAALNLLDEFPKQRCKPNERTFSTLMHALCKSGKVDDAFRLLERMEEEGISPDTVTFNILISGLRKQGRVDEGMEILERTMLLKGSDPNDGSYQEVLYGLIDQRRFAEAMVIMERMIAKRMKPSFISYKSMVSGMCKENYSVQELDWILRQMVRQGFVPKMGMWRQIVRAVASESTSCKEHLQVEQLLDDRAGSS